MTVVGLVPAATGARWWWNHIQGHAQIEFLPGRLAYDGPHAVPGQKPRWASAVILWQAEPAAAALHESAVTGTGTGTAALPGELPAG